MDKFSDAARRRRRRELDEMRAVVSKAEARLLELTGALNKVRSRVAAVRQPASAGSAEDFGTRAESRRADAAEFENVMANIEIELEALRAELQERFEALRPRAAPERSAEIIRLDRSAIRR